MKNIVITGGTFGIGYATVKSLLHAGHSVTMLARNSEKAGEMRNLPGGENLHFINTDLTISKSVIEAADKILKTQQSIDVLINNAGGIMTRQLQSSEGLEMTFALNHLGHFLLTRRLIPLLVKSKARIINVSSEAHKMGNLNLEDLQWKKRKYSAIKAYGDAKLCNIYFTRELHTRYQAQGISSFALHPGVVRTQFGLNSSGFFKLMVKLAQPLMISPEKGAETTLYLATQEGLEKYAGKYFVKKKVVSLSSKALHVETARKLWEISESLISHSSGD